MHTPLEDMKHQVFEATPIQGRHLFTSTLARYTQKTEPPMSWSLHFHNSGPSHNMVVLWEFCFFLVSRVHGNDEVMQLLTPQ